MSTRQTCEDWWGKFFGSSSRRGDPASRQQAVMAGNPRFEPSDPAKFCTRFVFPPCRGTRSMFNFLCTRKCMARNGRDLETKSERAVGLASGRRLLRTRDLSGAPRSVLRPVRFSDHRFRRSSKRLSLDCGFHQEGKTQRRIHYMKRRHRDETPDCLRSKNHVRCGFQRRRDETPQQRILDKRL